MWNIKPRYSKLKRLGIPKNIDKLPNFELDN